MNSKSIKKVIKKLLHSVGVEAYRYDPEATQLGRFMAALKRFNIDLVIDIDANEGQFGESFRESGYSGQIVSFEPLKAAHQNLIKNNSKYNKWIVHPRCAVGAHNGGIELNISANSVNSSVLPMLQSRIQAAQNAGYIGKDKCVLITLDSI